MALAPYRDEQLNYFKFATIVLDEFPKALRQTFKSMWNINFGYHPWDDSITVRNLFLTTEGGTTRVPTHHSYDEWDCTALFQATIYARSFALPDSTGIYRTLSDLYVKPRRLPHGSFHPSVKSPGGNNAETYALAIDQLRLLRNSMSHSHVSEIKKVTFDQYVQLAKEAFKVLGVNINSVDAVGGLTESDFPTRRVHQLEEDIRMELQAGNKFLQDELKNQLLDIQSDIVQSNQERQNDQKRTETERKEEIHDLKNQLKDDKNELKDKLEHITSIIIQSNQKQLEDRKVTEKELVNLTKQLQFNKDEVKEEIRKTAKKTIEATTAASQGVTENLAELKEKVNDLIISKKLVTLPKSCLPPNMPHFTGREKECDEIIGHVTSESTRIVSIWGSPGFGKTSVAIKVGHHLQSEGLPVYFLSLRGLRLKADLTSKLLSFLRTSSSNEPFSQPLSLDDELCELFSRVVDGCIFILDNADDLFENGATDVKEQVVNLLGEILGRNERVTFILTTRESLEFMNIHFQGLEAVRIRPLDKHSSENLVHKLLAPNASSSDCNRIIQICGHVPLAIKLVCSSISEDNAQPTQFLDEFMADKESNIIDILDEPDSNDLRLHFLFDSSFRRLSTQEKEVLVSLSILPENFSQDVAAAVLNLTRFSATKILQRLRRKSLIDSSSKQGSYQIHSLFQSFAREKGEQEMKETLLTSRARFYEFYISLFEKLNKQFLTGQSKSAFDQFYANKQCIMQSLTEGCTFCRTADIVFNVLVRAELFVSSVFLTGGGAMLYDSAIKAANNLKTNAFYRQLIVSRALFDIPLGAGGATMQLLSKAKGIQALPASVVDGEEGKSLCFSGICLLVAGKTEQGVQVLQEALPLLKDIPDQTVLRLSVCQILAIYYRLRKDSSSFRQFYSKALQECKAAGDTQLLVIPEMESTGKTNDQLESMSRRGNNNHPLQLQVILLVALATSSFSDFETKHFVNNAALEILKDNENGAQHSSPGLSQFQRNVILFFYVFNKTEDASKLSEASINYHEKALRQCKSNQEELQRRTKHFPEDETLHQESLSKSFWDLGSFQHMNGNFLEAIRAHHSALDIRLKLFGEEHSSTAESYHSLGSAQLAYGEFASALQSAKHALFVRLKLFGEEHSSTAESYLLLGFAQRAQGDFTSTLQSFQRVLDIRLKLFGEEHVSTADSYVFIGNVQYAQQDLMPAIESYRRALEIRRKLSGEEHSGTADSYVLLGDAQCGQHDFVSALKSYQRALDIRLKLFGEEHESTADSYHLLAETQSSQGDEGSALKSFERALDIRLKLFGEDHSSTADSYSALGQTQFFQGDLTSAVQSFKRALYIRRKLFGEEHSITAHSYLSLGDTQHAQGDLTSAIHSLQRSLVIRQKLFGEEHVQTARSYYSLGETQSALGDLTSALQSFQRALDIRLNLFGMENIETVNSFDSLAVTQRAQGDLTSALQSFQCALDIKLKLFGEEHSNTAAAYKALGLTQRLQGDFTSSLQSVQRALDITVKLFGEEHSNTADLFEFLGDTRRAQGDLTSALQSFQRALDIRLNLFGMENVRTADSFDSLAVTQHAQGDLTSALQSFQCALDIRLKLFGEEHSITADSYFSLAKTQYEQGDLRSALSAKRALDIRLRVLGEEHAKTAESYHSVGSSGYLQGDLTLALQSLQRALDIRIKLLGEEHSVTARSYCSLGFIQHAQGDWASALKSKQRALDITQKLFGEEHLKTAYSYLSLGDTQHAQGDFTSAFQSKQRALKTTMKLFLKDIAEAERATFNSTVTHS